MAQEPGFHEKIFRKFNGSTDSGSAERGPESPDTKELQRNLRKKLMFFFGPYTGTPSGESLFTAAMRSQQIGHQRRKTMHR